MDSLSVLLTFPLGAMLYLIYRAVSNFPGSSESGMSLEWRRAKFDTLNAPADKLLLSPPINLEGHSAISGRYSSYKWTS